MNRMSWWKWSAPLLLVGAMGLGTAQADDDDRMPPYGMGSGMMHPGMMGGYGPGYGMGPGMMQGYGPGYGMGPGMMRGDDAPYGYGPGYGMQRGYGMGSGMMGGPGMMGMGMMGLGPIWSLNLNENQRRAIDNIMNETHSQHWAMMTATFGAYGKLRELYAAEVWDATAIGKVYEEVHKNKRAMIESGIKTRNRIYDQLTKDQREQLKRWRWSEGWGR